MSVRTIWTNWFAGEKMHRPLCWPICLFRKNVTSQWDSLKFLDIAFTGVDHVDLDILREKGVQVSNAAGYSTQAVAELALSMMLSLLRHVPQVQERCRQGGTKDGLVGCELRGKTVGIVGAGAIGTRTAQLWPAFGCRVLGYRRHPVPTEGIEFVSLEELLPAVGYSIPPLPRQRRDPRPYEPGAHRLDEAGGSAD